MRLKSKTLAIFVITVCIYMLSLCVKVSYVELNIYMKISLVCVAVACICYLLYKAYKILI